LELKETEERRQSSFFKSKVNRFKELPRKEVPIEESSIDRVRYIKPELESSAFKSAIPRFRDSPETSHLGPGEYLNTSYVAQKPSGTANFKGAYRNTVNQ
jgi:hypothetical protein